MKGPIVRLTEMRRDVHSNGNDRDDAIFAELDNMLQKISEIENDYILKLTRIK